MLAAALAALDVDRREVAPSQHPQGLAEAERQAVALADEAWRGCERTRTALLPRHPDGYQALHPPPWVLPEETLPPTERPPSSPRTNPGAGHPVGCVRREQPRPHQQQGLQELAPFPCPALPGCSLHQSLAGLKGAAARHSPRATHASFAGSPRCCAWILHFLRFQFTQKQACASPGPTQLCKTFKLRQFCPIHLLYK